MSDPAIEREELLSAQDIENKLRRIASEIIEAHQGRDLAFVGIHSRGVVVAERVLEIVKEHRSDIEFGTLDISLYRDDLDNLGSILAIKGSDIPFNVEDSYIVLFDDVLFTGRTIRAAIDELIDYGRPSRIQLAVLMDRGNRELPIAADYTGEALQTSRKDHIAVRFTEKDNEEGVFLIKEPSAS